MREVIDGLFAKFGTTLSTETEPREELILPEPARTLWLATHAIIERTFAQTGGAGSGEEPCSRRDGNTGSVSTST